SSHTSPSALAAMPTLAAALEVTSGSQEVIAWIATPTTRRQPKNPIQARTIRQASLSRRSWPRNTPEILLAGMVSMPGNIEHRHYSSWSPGSAAWYAVLAGQRGGRALLLQARECRAGGWHRADPASARARYRRLRFRAWQLFLRTSVRQKVCSQSEPGAKQVGT
ncbi:MAG TPA: hypothetical protein VFA63_02130, partial [Pseudonocardiaceae bacterium]|nr:hypothetical protein [Pseudonocardiaceae bacterium]